MNSQINFHFLIIFLYFLSINVNYAISYTRDYQHGFRNGNLISNWSFENFGETWQPDYASSEGHVVYSRYSDDCCTPKSGSFVSFVAFQADNTPKDLLKSSRIEVKPATPYVLSFYYKNNNYNVSNQVRPRVLFFDGIKSSIESLPLNPAPDFISQGNFTKYEYGFTTGNSTHFVELVLVYLINVSSMGDDIIFDDVMLEEGSIATSDMINESVHFSDGLNRQRQLQTKFFNEDITTPGVNYLIQGTDFDNKGRVNKLTLPFVKDTKQVQFDLDPIGNSNSFFDGTNRKPNTNNFSFAEAEFANEFEARTTKLAKQGQIWSIDGRASETNYYFVNSTSSNNKYLDVPENIENPSSGLGTDFKLEWVRDPDLNYTLTWTNQKGQIVQEAANLDKNGATPNLWDWAVKRFEYHPNGQLKRTITPLDVEASTDINNPANEFNIVNNYNSNGLLSSTFSPDIGLEQFWYNKDGLIRFNQNELLYEGNQGQLKHEYLYTDYDDLGRVIGSGWQKFDKEIDESIYETLSYSGMSSLEKVEYKGSIYDDLGDFEERTGVSLSYVMPGILLENGRHQLVARYNKNPESNVYGFDEADKLVVTLYSYNNRGFVKDIYKFTGPVRDENKKRHRIHYTYDALDRIKKKELIVKKTGGDVLESVHHFSYDELGRVNEVSNGSGKNFADYSYFEWGPLKEVILGGVGDGSSGIKVEFNYHVQGWITEIKATHLTTSEIVYQEFIGYEDKATSDYSGGNPSPRFNGTITQKLIKFANDVNEIGRVRKFDYFFDETNRLLKSDWSQNQNSNPLIGTDLSIDWTNLILGENDVEQDSELRYDKNGRISKKWAGGISESNAATYTYQSDSKSYKLDNVSGPVKQGTTRGDMSSSGTFVYDKIGRLVADYSKKLSIDYSWENLPNQYEIEGESDVLIEHQFYDGEGNRVTKLEMARELIQGNQNYLVGNNESEPGVNYFETDITSALTAIQIWINGAPINAIPEHFTFYVVADRGQDEIMPMEGDIIPFEKDGVFYNFDLIGIKKDSPEYFSMLENIIYGEPKQANHYLRIDGSGDKEFSETYAEDWTVVESTQKIGVFGRGSQIGKKQNDGTYEFFIKNHQGSVVRSIDDMDPLIGNAFEYMAYGDKTNIKEGSDENTTPSYTGKELDGTTGLYYYGARWYDSELSMWLVPDAAKEFLNLYSYVGGNPINMTDPTGNKSAADMDMFPTQTPVDTDGDGKADAIVTEYDFDNIVVTSSGATSDAPIPDAPADAPSDAPSEAPAETPGNDESGSGSSGVLEGSSDGFASGQDETGLADAFVDGAIDGLEALETVSDALMAGRGGLPGPWDELAGLGGKGISVVGVGAIKLFSRGGSKATKSGVKFGSKGGPGAGKAFSTKTKGLARSQAKDKCVFCGTKTTGSRGPNQSNIDHAIPKSRGGNNTLPNAQNTCRTCNLQKGTKTTEEFIKFRTQY